MATAFSIGSVSARAIRAHDAAQQQEMALRSAAAFAFSRKISPVGVCKVVEMHQRKQQQDTFAKEVKQQIVQGSADLMTLCNRIQQQQEAI
jgi:hypothetical protein